MVTQNGRGGGYAISRGGGYAISRTISRGGYTARGIGGTLSAEEGTWHVTLASQQPRRGPMQGMASVRGARDERTGDERAGDVHREGTNRDKNRCFLHFCVLSKPSTRDFAQLVEGL